MQILSGDIGATNTRIALVEIASNSMCIHWEQTLISSNFNNVQEIIEHVIAISSIQPQLIGLGIAGPIFNQTSKTTNLPWHIDGQSLERALKISKVHLINDLEATAWGIQSLQFNDYFELHSGQPDPHGNIAIIAAGTGLGKAGICRQNNQHQPFPSEGGHTDFAPANQLEWDMLQFFAQRYNHVSWERILSGPGIPIILDFLLQYRKNNLAPTLLENIQQKGAEIIVAAANAKECPLCEETLTIFTNLYAREAGNYALNIMATGGIYLAGGIAPKILPHLRAPNFIHNFFNKGRMKPLMQTIPIRILLNNKAALYGAALAAIQQVVFPSPPGVNDKAAMQQTMSY